MCEKLLHLVPVALVLTLMSGLPCAASTLLRYDFSDGNGTTVTDLSGNDNHGTLVGFADTTAGAGVFDSSEGWVPGGGLCFIDGGARSFVETPLNLSALPGDFTLEFMANYAGSSGWTPAIGSNASGCCGQALYFGIHNNLTDAEVRLQNSGGPVGPHPWSSPPDLTVYHLALVYDAATNGVEVFVDGVSIGTATRSANMAGASTQFRIGNTGWSSGEQWDGIIFGIAISDVKLDPDSYALLTAPVLPVASGPVPADEATDVPRDVALNWTPGQFAPAVNGHRVYLSENFSDVNDGVGGITVSAASYAPAQRLEFDKTYYWRVDEVNDAPDFTVHPGEVWSFTTEPVGYPLVDITATASSSSPGQEAENTVNGSGLDADDLHSNENDTMWLSQPGGAEATWIEYEFDRIYKLNQMWVWNFNIELENVIGLGLNDVTIEYSIDGSNWTQLEGVPQFAKAPGTDDYVHDTTIDFAGTLAKFVRLTANSNHGPLNQYGLSEVRFFYIPGWAREPDPQDGVTGVHPDVILNWRSGREAATHDVYISTDEQDVMGATAPAATVAETNYDAGTLELGATYYWRVDELNETETPSVWDGDIWSFTTAEHLVVDDFESYNGLEPSDPQSNRVFMIWKDGVGYGTQDNPPYSAGNGTGSIIGHATAPFVELDIARGGQSMPYFYNNTGVGGKANYSEVQVNITELGAGSDWTKAGVETLTLYFYGDPTNSAGETMYVKINGVEVLYDGDSSNITHGIWQQWDIDLLSLVGVDLQNVTELTIGFRDGGGSGVVYFDDILLNPAPRIPEQKAPDASSLVAQWEFEGDFNDTTGKGHDGLAYGDPTIVNDPLRGQVLEVDGDGRVGIGDTPDLNFGANESVTLTAWVNFELEGSPGGWQGIVAKGRTEMGGGTGYVPELYGFYVSPGGNWHVNAGGIGGDAHEAVSGQWYHLAFVQDSSAGEGHFYIDGEVVISGGTDSCDTTGRPLFIGAAGTDVSVFESFKGRIDDVRIYSYALSEPEIQYLVAGLQAPDDGQLVARWDFEGDYSDSTGKGHDGLAFGDPTIVNDPLRGQVLEVDGDDRIGVSDAADLNFGATESLTLTAWANLDLTGPGGWRGIVAKGRTELGGGTGYVPELYGFYVSPSNNWHINSGGVNGDVHEAAGGQWHHLAFVQDGPANEGYFYIDGEVVMSGGADSCDTTGRPLFIGAAGTDVGTSVFEAFKGRIDDVRIYSYALSELEIQYLVLAK